MGSSNFSTSAGGALTVTICNRLAPGHRPGHHLWPPPPPNRHLELPLRVKKMDIRSQRDYLLYHNIYMEEIFDLMYIKVENSGL